MLEFVQYTDIFNAEPELFDSISNAANISCSIVQQRYFGVDASKVYHCLPVPFLNFGRSEGRALAFVATP
jgi:hypothetical protein